MQNRNDQRTNAVAYVRRSTDRQERSLEDQLTAIEVYGAAQGLTLLRTYTDDAISGVRADDRSAFQDLIRDAQGSQRDFGTILVYDIKRFGRVDNDEAGHLSLVVAAVWGARGLCRGVSGWGHA